MWGLLSNIGKGLLGSAMPAITNIGKGVLT